MKSQIPAFRSTFSKGVPSLLKKLNCSIAISTYQAGKVILISPRNDENLVQLARNFDKAMGMSFYGKRMAVATRDRVHILANSPELAQTYPKKAGLYDAIFLPRSTYYTGLVDIHDIHLGRSKIHAINTSFSCLVELSDAYSWKPIWQPSHIDRLASEDRCHLNGLVVGKEGNPSFATSLGSGNSFRSWKKSIPDGGHLYDVQKDTILLADLKMPHSPRIYDGRLYLLESAIGAVVEYNFEQNTKNTVAEIPAFVRGLAIYEGYLFVGRSQLRSSSLVFQNLPIAQKNIVPGISIIHLATGNLVGEINYHNSVEEIYDLQILPDYTRPNIINPESKLAPLAISTPEATFWAKKQVD